MTFTRLCPLALTTSFPWCFLDVVKLTGNLTKWHMETKQSIFWRCFRGCKGKKLVCIHPSSLPTQLGDLEMNVTFRALFLFFGKLEMWLAGKGISDKHQGKENFGIFVQLWGRDEGGETAAISGGFKHSEIWNFNKSLCSFCDNYSSLKICSSAFRTNLELWGQTESERGRSQEGESGMTHTRLFQCKQAIPELKILKRKR